MDIRKTMFALVLFPAMLVSSGAGPNAEETKPGQPKPPPAAGEAKTATDQKKLPAASQGVNDFIAVIKKEIQQNDLLVVLLYDEGKSMLEDRKTVIEEMGRAVANLRKEMTPRQAARLKWAVLSYSAKPTLWLQPTDKIEDLMESAKKIKIDDTGVGNVCAAIGYTVSVLSPLSKKMKMKMYVVAITDKEGDDTHNERTYMGALHDLTAAKAKFFVFGRESLFQQGNYLEWVHDATGQRVSARWTQRGFESCRQEFFAKDSGNWLFNPHSEQKTVRSGFGCWSLTTLAELTQGAFYLIGEHRPAYDEDTMDKYKPEWVTPGEYAERNGKSKLRLTLRKIIDEWTKVTPPLSLRQFEQLKKECDEAIAKGEKAMKWSEGAINEMKVLRGRRSGEKFAKLRWQANYDLALAQLYKLRFMLRDYVAVLRETKTTGFPKPKPDAKFNCYIITFDRSFSKLLLGPPALKDWDQANKALEQVITDYDGTPWAEMAKLQKETLAPITIRPAYAITHGGYITISAE